ncbi:MAG TPA: N-acetylmuramoyl-L-alanine amidase [Candidatus Scatomonas pullistercoris]|uniref:N-acetylmuramoyl-L-alanine amidase n=1 Tax=Candidatus Scatomonas pullistercoris TaxID=2840920 RepID=A0A9D1P4D4_9FIRM|nr:N-acetylmuramoyl-L-alanine amidase [Candidatus Scatomonas pullistercoris]
MGRKKRRMTKKARRRQRNLRVGAAVTISLLCAAGLLLVRNRGITTAAGETGGVAEQENYEKSLRMDAQTGDLEALMPEMDVQLLTPNEYSRPQIPLEDIGGIVIHYTANPGTTAQENRNYFEGLKDTGATYASSHFVIGLEGEIIQCLPSSEISYASNFRNSDTLSIECCHPDDSGQFTDATYQSLVQLTAWLCENFQVPADQVIRHYDVTGKECPKYFVDHPDAWEQFRQDTAARMAAIEAEAG